MILLFYIVEHDRNLSEKDAAGVKQKKSLPAGVSDEDSCLKLDLGALDQNITPRAGTVAGDSARTLADIPDDYLMSAASARTAADESSVAAGAQPVLASPRPETAQVPAVHTASVASVEMEYSEDFSKSAAISNNHGAVSRKPSQTDESKHSSPVTEETVKTEADISEVLSDEDQIKSSCEQASLSTSDKAASLSRSAAVDVVTAFPPSPGAAGNCRCINIAIHSFMI